jgi:hypothetical protein
MKTSKYLIISFLLLSSCGLNLDIEKSNYKLINNSGKELRIEFYLSNSFKYSKIVNNEGILEARAKEPSNVGIIPSSAFIADSIIVSYENEKRQIYTRISRENWQNVNPKLRNILEDDSYSIDSEGTYIFTFTEEDYQNAEKL